jgi:hypothetical protein
MGCTGVDLLPETRITRLQLADPSGSMKSFFRPPLTPDEREVARIEGLILGVV